MRPLLAVCMTAALAGAAEAAAQHRMRSGCRKGDLDKVQRELATGVDINDADQFGFTCLHEASTGGHVEVLRHALSLGANPAAKSSKAAGHRSGEQPLHAAASGGHVAVISELLDQQGVDPDAVTDSGMTPLHFACGLGHEAATEVLVGRVASPDPVNQFGSTPLHLAAADGQVAIVRHLLAAGASVASKNKFGNTPLHSAAASGFTETVEALLEAGADPTATNSEDDAPAAHMRRRAQSSPEHAPTAEVMEAVEAALDRATRQRDEL